MVDISEHIDTLRVVSTVGLGLLAGASAATTTMVLPPLYKTLDPASRLKFWSDHYERGKSLIPPVASLSSISIGLVVYYAEPVLGRGFVGAHRREILGVAGLTTILMIPWTVAVMMPNIQRLKAIEAGLDSGKKDASVVGLESDAGIVKWDKQHLVRTLAYSFSFVLAALELAAC